MTGPNGEIQTKKNFSPEERDQAIQLHMGGCGNKEIAQTLGIHGHVVNSILNCARRGGFIPRKEKALVKGPSTPPGSSTADRPPMPQSYLQPAVRAVVPVDIIKMSIMNRVLELGQTVDSVVRRLGKEDIDIGKAKGEITFLRKVAVDIEYLLEQLNQATEKI